MSDFTVSKDVFDAVALAGFQCGGAKMSDKEGMFEIYLTDPDCINIGKFSDSFEFDGTNDGLSFAIKQRADELNNLDIDKYARDTAQAQNTDAGIVQAELERYSADIDRLYTCVELSCIKEDIQELRDIVHDLLDKEAPQKQTAEKGVTDKDAVNPRSNPVR